MTPWTLIILSLLQLLSHHPGRVLKIGTWPEPALQSGSAQQRKLKRLRCQQTVETFIQIAGIKITLKAQANVLVVESLIN